MARPAEPLTEFCNCAAHFAVRLRMSCDKEDGLLTTSFEPWLDLVWLARHANCC
jgi:hypothetical protein